MGENCNYCSRNLSEIFQENMSGNSRIVVCEDCYEAFQGTEIELEWQAESEDENSSDEQMEETDEHDGDYFNDAQSSDILVGTISSISTDTNMDDISGSSLDVETYDIGITAIMFALGCILGALIMLAFSKGWSR